MYYNNDYYQQDDYAQSPSDSYYSDDYDNNEDNNDINLMSARSNAEANYGNRNPAYVQDLEEIKGNHKVYKQRRLKNGEIIYTKQNEHSDVPINENTTFYSCFAYSILHNLGEFGIDATKQVGINSFKNGGTSMEKLNTIYNAMLNVLQLNTTLGYDTMSVYLNNAKRNSDRNFMSIINIENEYLKYGRVSPTEYRKASNFYKKQLDALIRSIKSDKELDTFCALYVLAYDFGFSDIKEYNWCWNQTTGKITNIDYDSGIRNGDVETPSLFLPPVFLIRKKVFTDYIENSPYLQERLNYVRNRIDKVVSKAISNNGLWKQHYTSLLSKAHNNTMERKLSNMTNRAVSQKIDPITKIYEAYSRYTRNFSYNKFNRILPRTAMAIEEIYNNKQNIYSQLSKDAERKKQRETIQKKFENDVGLYQHRQLTPENNKAIFFNKQIVNNNMNNYQQQNVQNKYYSDEQRLYEDQQQGYRNKLPPINDRFQQHNDNGNGLYNNMRITPNNKLPPINNQKYYDYQMRKIMGQAI